MQKLKQGGASKSEGLTSSSNSCFLATFSTHAVLVEPAGGWWDVFPWDGRHLLSLVLA